jgi:DNA-binding response OmpR family regulator
MRRMMKDVIQALGINSIELCSSHELNETDTTTFKPDIIFVDWSAGCDGLELLQRIRSNAGDFDRFIPIVMVTAYTGFKQVCAARDAGVTEFLAKPITANAIYRRLSAMIENPRDFVETNDFFGPDRRRRSIDPAGPERRAAELEKRSVVWHKQQAIA